MTEHQMPGLMTTADVVAVTKLSRTTIYRMRCAGEFPEPCELGSGRLRWCRTDVDHWLQGLRRHDGVRRAIKAQRHQRQERQS